MRRHDITLCIAVCVSLAAHALLFGSVAEVYSYTTGKHIWLAGFPWVATWEAPKSANEPPPILLGADEGVGDATDSLDAQLPQQARQSDHVQPTMSFDPVGAGQINNAPSDSVLPVGAPSTSAPQALEPTEVGLKLPVGDFNLPTSDGDKKSTDSAKPAPQQVVEQSAQATSPQLPADPAPQGSSESDPVSVTDEVEFRAGKTNVRLGEVHRAVRPRLSLASLADFASMSVATVVLKLEIDETGKVTKATVHDSSGSRNLDQDVTVAAYQWFFPPGPKPAKRVRLLSIRFSG